METTQDKANVSTRQRRSEKLTPQEFASFKKYAKKFDTKLDVMEILGVTRPTLLSILKGGSGRPSTIARIREAINPETAQA